MNRHERRAQARVGRKADNERPVIDPPRDDRPQAGLDDIAAYGSIEDVMMSALDAITEDQELALEVIDGIAFLSRHYDPSDEEDAKFRRELKWHLAEEMAASIGVEEEMKNDLAAEAEKMHQLGRYILSMIDKDGADEALYVLVAGVCGALADRIVDGGSQMWTIGVYDEELVAKATKGDGAAPVLAPGALDRARVAMRDAGWLAWRVEDGIFFYFLMPPENWRELVEINEAAIEAADQPLQ